MKSRIWSGCLVAMFLLAPVALGEIVPSSHGSPGGASPYAYANGSSPFVDVYAWGDESYYTTTDIQNGHMSYYVSAWAEAHVRSGSSGSCAAAAGYADADGLDGSKHVSAGVGAYGPGDDDGTDAPTDPTPGQADGFMLAWTSTSASYEAEATAVVDQGSGQTAWANAYIVAWCSLYED